MKRRISACLALALVTACTRSPEPARPNIILISLDTLRAQSLGAYGHERPTSPFFDQLAGKGVLFENAITPSTITGPAHMSLFSGVYPQRHGMISGFEKGAVAESLPLLAPLLKEAGYTTKAITENGFIIRRKGFDRGFDDYTELSGPHKHSSPGLAEESFRLAREWLTGAPTSPFFLFLHTYEVHHPYDPPPSYGEVFHEQRNRPVDTQRDLYDSEILFLDDQLRQLFDTAQELGRTNDTIFVLLSDHGEEFKEHGAMQHGTHVFEESIRIPMLFYGAGIEARRVARQVSLIDILPTLLDLAGLPTQDEFDGISLAETIAKGTPPTSRPLFVEAPSQMEWVTTIYPREVEPIKIGLRFDDRKFISHRARKGEAEPTVLYDLAQDPGEQQPIKVSGEELAAVESVIDDYLRAGTLGNGQQAGDAESFQREADPALVERLRSLGYLQ